MKASKEDRLDDFIVGHPHVHMWIVRLNLEEDFIQTIGVVSRGWKPNTTVLDRREKEVNEKMRRLAQRVSGLSGISEEKLLAPHSLKPTP